MPVTDAKPNGPREKGARRRRGAELERAILDVAWLELREAGYGALTFEAVASRAGTSRPVLARRWPTRADLAVAAIRQRMATHHLDIPDLGDVRAELLEFLRQSVDRGWPFAMMFTCQMMEYYRETNTNAHQLRDAVRSADENEIFNILHRAIERGEIDGRKLSPSIVRLPKDLLFNNSMMNFAPPDERAIVDIIDNLFLPLIRIGT